MRRITRCDEPRLGEVFYCLEKNKCQNKNQD
nr:MAG TPA: hypothetical protein [Caudoviricetes sp.]